MSRFITNILFWTAAIAGIIASAFEVDGKVPEGLDFSSTVFDFGTVRQDAEAVSTEFTMTNTGSTPVAILSASTSCGCSKAEYQTKPVQPGKSTKINVKFNPAGQRGEIHREIKLRLKRSGGKSQRVVLTITGTVVP